MNIVSYIVLFCNTLIAFVVLVMLGVVPFLLTVCALAVLYFCIKFVVSSFKSPHGENYIRKIMK